MEALHSFAGVFILASIAWLFSENRRQIPWRIVLVGILLQFVLALLILRLPQGRVLFTAVNMAVLALQRATDAGTSFVFGYLAGGVLPFELRSPGADFILAIRALPLVLVVSALSSLLFHWRILPVVVSAFSWLLQKSCGIGGAVGLGAAANIFVGMIEAPLLIKPYLRDMQRHELFAVMTCGMATIAGTVMVLYATVLEKTVPDAAGHLLTASIISAPAALVVANLMIPGRQRSEECAVQLPKADSAMDAIVRGAGDGLSLLLNIVAMLVVFVALVHLANQILGLLPPFAGAPVTMQSMLGMLLSPLAWIMGIPWHEARTAGALLGSKTVLNELIAYLEMAKLSGGHLGPKSRLIMTYALCGFANLGSLGIMIGGMGTIVPERKREIVELGLRSIIAGTLAACMTGAVVGVVMGQ